MKAIDIVKPEPKTELEAWHRLLNRLQGEYIAYFGKRIEVKYVSDNT